MKKYKDIEADLLQLATAVSETCDVTVSQLCSRYGNDKIRRARKAFVRLAFNSFKTEHIAQFVGYKGQASVYHAASSANILLGDSLSFQSQFRACAKRANELKLIKVYNNIPQL